MTRVLCYLKQKSKIALPLPVEKAILKKLKHLKYTILVFNRNSLVTEIEFHFWELNWRSNFETSKLLHSSHLFFFFPSPLEEDMIGMVSLGIIVGKTHFRLNLYFCDIVKQHKVTVALLLYFRGF